MAFDCCALVCHRMTCVQVIRLRAHDGSGSPAQRMLSVNEQDHVQENFDAIESEIGIESGRAGRSMSAKSDGLRKVQASYDSLRRVWMQLTGA